MKKAKISFRVIGDSGPLSISWFEGPKGDAVEAKNEIGVGFFSGDGELLSVEFDDVKERRDHQVLEFSRYQVVVDVNKSKISYSLIPLESKKRITRTTKSRHRHDDEDAA